MRTHRPLAAATAVYNEASGIYWQAFRPLAAIAGAIGLAFNLVLIVRPTFFISTIGWYLFVNFVGVAMISSALLVPMVMAVRGQRSASGLPTQGVREHGWHIAIATFVLILANGILVFTVLGILFAAFLSVRFAFIAVASTVEDTDITDSLARSWELTSGVWNRTAGVLLGAVAPAAGLFVVLPFLSLPWLVVFLAIVAIEALVVPFVVVVLVLMFDEYRALQPESEDVGPHERP